MENDVEGKRKNACGSDIVISLKLPQMQAMHGVPYIADLQSYLNRYKKYKKGDRKTDPKTGVTIERCERGISVTYPRERINGETLPAVTVWFSGSAQEEVEVVFDPRKSVVLKLIADYRLNDGDVWMAGRKSEDKRGWYLQAFFATLLGLFCCIAKV